MENLLSAEQALKAYNKDQIAIEKFFKTIVEPQIRQVYQNETHLDIDVNDIWDCGTQIDGLQNSDNVHLTGPFLALLHKLGYSTFVSLESKGDVYYKGHGKLTISWKGEN